MLIIVCGLPQSGKSTVVDKCQEYLNATLYRPGDWVPKNLAAISMTAEADIRNAALATAKVDVSEWMEESKSSDIAILDDRNEDHTAVMELFGKAARFGHQVLLLYVNAKSTECAARSDVQWGYAESAGMIVKSLPQYKILCDKVIVVHNNGSLSDLDHSVAAIKENLCQGT